MRLPQRLVKLIGNLLVANGAGMETIAANIFGMLAHRLSLTVKIDEQDMMAAGGGSDDSVIRLDL